MSRISLRNYLTPSQLQEYQPTVNTVDNNILIEAEKDIDNAIATYATGGFSKAYKGWAIYTDVVFNGQTATLSNFNGISGSLSRTIVELLTGSKLGDRFFVQSQDDNVLTFSSDTQLETTESVKLFQFAKAPFHKDYVFFDGISTKLIDERIREAVAYQYVYRLNNDVDTKYPVSSYSVQGENYHEVYGIKEDNSIRERISPQAMDLIAPFTVQSLK